MTALCHHFTCALSKSHLRLTAQCSQLRCHHHSKPHHHTRRKHSHHDKPPAQDRQGQHLALCTPHSGGLSGRLAIQSPPNVAFDRPSPGGTPANTTSRRTSFCSKATTFGNAPTVTRSASQSWEQRSERLTSPLPRQVMLARESITQPGETWNISIVEVTQEKQAENKVRGKDRFFDSSMKRDNKFLRWNSIQEQFLMCKDAPSLTRRISSSTCKRRSRRTPYQALVKIETVAARASHQETLSQTNKEVEELRKVRCSAADLREAAFLQERQSTVTQLTHQPQEVVNSLSESQDFKDLETASSSGSPNAPGKPFVFSEFFNFAGADKRANKRCANPSHPSTEILSEACPQWSFHRLWKRYIHENSWSSSRSTTSWNCSLRSSLRRPLTFIGTRISKLQCVLVQVIRRRLCHG